jgi:hypothetical protein
MPHTCLMVRGLGSVCNAPFAHPVFTALVVDESDANVTFGEHVLRGQSIGDPIRMKLPIGNYRPRLPVPRT